MSNASESRPLLSTVGVGASGADGGPPLVQGDSGIDIDKMLEETIKMRLDRLNANGAFIPPAKPQKGDLRKGGRKAPVPNHWDCSTCMPNCPPGPVDICSLLCKYVPDIVVQGMYLAGGYYIYAYGTDVIDMLTMETLGGSLGTGGSYVNGYSGHSTWMFANATANVSAGSTNGALAAMGNGGGAGMAFSQTMNRRLQELNATAAAEKEQADAELFLYWSVGAGAASGAMLVIKNVCNLAGRIASMVNRVKHMCDTSIDRLQGELQDDVAEILQDAPELVVAPVVDQLRKAIDGAQKELDLRKMVPCLFRSTCMFTIVFSLPFLIIVAIKAALAIMEGVPDAEEEPSETALRRLTANGSGNVTDVEFMEFLHTEESVPMIRTAAMNACWALIAIWPLQRFVVNNIIAVMQRLGNEFLLNSVKSKIPGGTASLQTAIDMAEGPMAFLDMDPDEAMEQVIGPAMADLKTGDREVIHARMKKHGCSMM